MDIYDRLRSLYNNNKRAYLSIREEQIGGENKNKEYVIYDNPYTLESLDGEDNGFPYSKNFMPDPDTMMAMLKQTKLDVKRGDHRIVLKRYWPGDYILTDSISNHFTEKIRMECQFNKFDTPREAWNDRVRSEVKKILENDDRSLTYFDVFEMIYADKNTRFCNTFNEAYTMWIIRSAAEKMGKSVNKIRLLDPSSGWGNRLIGSYAAEIAEYKGYDPNSKLTPLYKDIISYFGDKMKAEILEMPFEDSNDRKDYYDIVLTSPPYFSYEIYDEGEGQSVTKYPEYEDWVKNMYNPYLRKAYSYLREGGIMVIYIEDIFIEGKRYHLSSLTDTIMAELGGQKDLAYGLNTKYRLGKSSEDLGNSIVPLNKSSKHKNKMRGRYANSWIKPISQDGGSSEIETDTENDAEFEIELGTITKSDRDTLLSIVSDQDLMKGVGNGRPWTAEKLDKFIAYMIEDENIPTHDRENFYNTIVAKYKNGKKKVIGLIGIHTVRYFPDLLKGKFFTTRVIDKAYQGKGIGSKVMKLAVEKFIKSTGKPVYSHVRPDNIASFKSLEKVGFVRDESLDVVLKGEKLIGYKLEPDILVGGDSDPDVSDIDESKELLIHTFIELRDIDIIKKVFADKVAHIDTDLKLRWLDPSKPIHDKYVDIMMIDGKYTYDRDLYDISSDLKGNVVSNIITDKIELHSHIKEDFIPETHILDETSDLSFMDGKDWWIWRPEGGRRGWGIEYVRTVRDAQKLQKRMLTKKSKKGKMFRALLSKVIKNPLLYYPDGSQNGYKCHFRMYLILYKPDKNNEIRCYFVNKGEIFTTNVPYRHTDFNNKSIHDTHQKTTIGSPLFPHDCDRLGVGDDRLTRTDCDLIIDRMADILRTILSKDDIRNRIEVYPESKGGYDMLGCDFMIDRSGKVYLIEINANIGYPDKTEATYEWLNKLLANVEFDTVLGPRFFGTDPHSSKDSISIFDSVGINGGSKKESGIDFSNIDKTYIAYVKYPDVDTIYEIYRNRGWTDKMIEDKVMSGSHPTELDPDLLDQIFSNREWTKLSIENLNTDTELGLLYLSGPYYYDTKMYDIRSIIKNTIIAENIINKVNLHDILTNVESSAIPETIVITSTTRPIIPREGESWIWRPEEGFAGSGIHVITTQKELDSLWQTLPRRGRRNRAILTKYIDNPALYVKEGKRYKFHLRLYLYIITDGVHHQNYLYRYGRLFHAAREYMSSGYGDKDIHDTHLSSSTLNLKFPDDYPADSDTTDEIFDRIRSIMSDVMSHTQNGIKPYPESRIGYQLFGIDVMVDDQNRPWLLEINHVPGLGDTPVMIQFLSEFIFGGLNDTLLAQIDGEPVKDTYLVAL